MPQSIEEWYQTMPPITKAYFLAAVGSTVFCAASVVSPFSLYLDFDMIVGKLEVQY